MLNRCYTPLTSCALILCLLVFPVILFAQEYKALTSSDIIIINGSSRHPYNKMILQKDSSLLPTGYYTAPDKKDRNRLYFYIAPNGKLNNTLKTEDASSHAYSLVSMNDDKAEGKATAYVDSVLHTEMLLKNGVPILVKRYSGKALEAETARKEDGSVLWTKEYKNGRMSYMMEECEGGRNYRQSLYPTGKIAREMYVDMAQGRSTEKKFNEKGILIYLEEIYGGTMTLKKEYDNNGKLSSLVTMKGEYGTRQEYDPYGKLVHTSEISPATAPVIDVVN